MTETLPAKGIRRADLEKEMTALRQRDADQSTKDWTSHCFLYTFHANDEVQEIAKTAFMEYLKTDALSDIAFPSIGKFQSDMSDYMTELLRGNPNSGGTMTTGGTESIILTMQAARNWARSQKGIAAPEVILAETAHPAFTKAAQLLDVKVVSLAVGSDFCLDAGAVQSAITENTCMIVGSAPTYWHGVFDPIAALNEIALEHDLWLHVDGCMGAILGSFARLAGYDIPTFDFSLDGVRSISADFHKYGFSMKGASILMLRNIEERKYHTFDMSGYAQYVTPGLPGTKSGAAIASAWAVFNFLGRDGFIELAAATMRARDTLVSALDEMDGVHVNGRPGLSLITFSSDDVDIFAVASSLQERGWVPNAFHNPDCIHVRLTPAHEAIIDEFVENIRLSIADARAGRKADGLTGVYATQ